MESDQQLTVTVPMWVNTKKAASIIGVSDSYISAIKRGMGISRARIFRLDRLLEWLEENPDFRAVDAYRQKQPSTLEQPSQSHQV